MTGPNLLDSFVNFDSFVLMSALLPFVLNAIWKGIGRIFISNLSKANPYVVIILVAGAVIFAVCELVDGWRNKQ